MTRHGLRPWAAWVIWLLGSGLCVLIALNSRFSADMSFFLPAQPSPAQQVLVDQLKNGAVSKLLMVAISGGEVAQRAAASRALRQQLAAGEHFALIQNGAPEDLERERELLFAHRYLLSPAISASHFEAPALHAAIRDSIELLASPLGMVLKPIFTRDPSGELLKLLSTLGDARQPPSRGGVWASRDGERALLLLQTRADGADTDGQAAAIAAIEHAFDTLPTGQTTEQTAALTLQMSGPGYFAVEARSRIQQEVFQLSLLCAGLIIIVLGLLYRSPRLIVLSMLPVVSGMAAGVAAVALVHDTVFGVTVGFGAALIGEAVDYSTYYFTQAGRLGLAGWKARFWPTIRLGVLTSVCGFVALLFAGFPGLAQLGLYSLAGVGAAALVARYLLPPMAGEVRALQFSARANRRIDRGIALLQRGRWPVLLLAALATLWLYSVRDQLWQADLSALSTVSAAEAELDTRLRADLSAPDSRYLVIVTAADQQAALQAAERSARLLDGLVADGVIDAYDSPARLLPSFATQAARQAALPDAEALRAQLAQALNGLPLQASRLEDFIDEVAAARNMALVERATFADSSLGLAIDALILPRAQQWSVLLPLHPSAAHDYIIPAEQVRAALADSDALFIDLKGEFDQLYGDYLDEAIFLSAAGALAILLMLVWSLRSAQRLAPVALPLLLAIIFVLAGLHLGGQRLHLLHLIGMLLIVAVGSNYTLFLDRASSLADPEVRLSTGVATLTTAIGFGVLGLSSVPVLNAIGLTVGPGALLSLLLAVMFAAPIQPHAPTDAPLRDTAATC